MPRCTSMREKHNWTERKLNLDTNTSSLLHVHSRRGHRRSQPCLRLIACQVVRFRGTLARRLRKRTVRNSYVRRYYKKSEENYMRKRENCQERFLWGTVRKRLGEIVMREDITRIVIGKWIVRKRHRKLLGEKLLEWIIIRKDKKKTVTRLEEQRKLTEEKTEKIIEEVFRRAIVTTVKKKIARILQGVRGYQRNSPKKANSEAKNSEKIIKLSEETFRATIIRTGRKRTVRKSSRWKSLQSGKEQREH